MPKARNVSRDTSLHGTSDAGSPGGGIGLLRGDHVEGQALAAMWMLGVDREASQISQDVAPGAQIGSNHCCVASVLGGEETRSGGSTKRRPLSTKFLVSLGTLHSFTLMSVHDQAPFRH